MNALRLLPAVTRIDGDARYRVDGAGTRFVLIPAICRLKKHRLGTTGYRVTESEGILRIRCEACAYTVGVEDGSWVLRSTGPIASVAVIDDAAVGWLDVM
jgi:hypothetical protein